MDIALIERFYALLEPSYKQDLQLSSSALKLCVESGEGWLSMEAAMTATLLLTLLTEAAAPLCVPPPPSAIIPCTSSSYLLG